MVVNGHAERVMRIQRASPLLSTFSRPSWRWNLVLFILVSSACSQSYAFDGSFDTSFAGTGRRVFSVSGMGGDAGQKVLETDDGKILFGGRCSSINSACLARFLTDGTFDSTFGPLGLGYSRFSDFPAGPPQGSSVVDMALLPDGRVAIVGLDKTEQIPAIYVLRQDGTELDLSVGHGTGYLNNVFGAMSVCTPYLRIARQSDGKFIVVGCTAIADSTTAVIVARVLSDLSGLDSSFGTDGLEQLAFNVDPSSGQNGDLATALSIQPDGRIVVGGNGYDFNTSKTVAAVARLTTNGQRDTSFGLNADGRYHFADATVSTNVTDLALDPSGEIVFGGTYYAGSGNPFFLLAGRLTTDGLLESTFGGGIVLFNASSTGGEGVLSVAVTADSVLTASYVPRNDGTGGTYFQGARLDRYGALVPSFGINGTSHASFGDTTRNDYPQSIALTRHGLVLAGYSADSSGLLEFGISRLQYEHLFQSAFE